MMFEMKASPTSVLLIAADPWETTPDRLEEEAVVIQRTLSESDGGGTVGWLWRSPPCLPILPAFENQRPALDPIFQVTQLAGRNLGVDLAGGQFRLNRRLGQLPLFQ